MKASVIIGLAILSNPCFAASARDYYKELYAAGGLDQILSEHACFDERPELETFFVFSSTKRIREVMIADGSYAKAPKALQDGLKQDVLLFRGYDKGVPLSSQDNMHSDNNGGWLSDKFMLDKQSAQVHFNITWETLRYKRSVESINPDGSAIPIISTYGRCELVPPGVKQHGK